MNESQFSEAQFQAATNFSIILQYSRFSNPRAPVYPVIPTLVAEFDLGWDSGFYFDWLHLPANHQGCNFFIQYKISNEYVNKNSRLYKHWKKSYLSFRIPHRKNGKNDFHQLKRLRKISKEGYPVFYATNSFIKNSELQKLYRTQTLLEKIPFLDVSVINKNHIDVSFSKKSKNFLLHSSPEKCNVTTWNEIKNSLDNRERATLGQDNEKLFSLFKSLNSDAKVSEYVNGVYQRMNTYSEAAPYIKFWFMRAIFFNVFGISIQRHIFKENQ